MTITIRTLFAAVCFTCVFPLATSAQTTRESDTLRSLLAPAPPTSNPDRSSVNVAEIQSDLEQLLETTQQLRQQREINRDTAPGDTRNVPGLPLDRAPLWNRPSRQLGSQTGQDSLDDQDSSTSIETPRSVDEIRERIRMLQRLRSRPGSAPPPPSVQQILQPPLPLSSTPLNADDEPKADDAAAAQSPIEPSLTDIQINLETKSTSVPDLQQIAQPSILAKRMMDRPVDSLALAESLYRTGNIQSALKALRSVELDGLSPSDRSWIDLLTALCQRRLGQGDDAEALFREIANDKSVDYPTQAAKWWLAHTEKTNQTQPAMKALDAEISQLLQRSQEYVQR